MLPRMRRNRAIATIYNTTASPPLARRQTWGIGRSRIINGGREGEAAESRRQAKIDKENTNPFYVSRTTS